MFRALWRFIFNVFSSKTLYLCLRHSWVLSMIIHAIMFYMTGLFFDDTFWTPRNCAGTPSAPGSRVRDPDRILGTFLEILVTLRTELSRMRKEDMRNNLQQKYMMLLPYFGLDLDSKKKVVWILAHAWLSCSYQAMFHRDMYSSRTTLIKSRHGHLDVSCHHGQFSDHRHLLCKRKIKLDKLSRKGVRSCVFIVRSHDKVYIIMQLKAKDP